MEENKQQLAAVQDLGGLNQSGGKDPKRVPDPGGGQTASNASTRTNTGSVVN